MESIGNKVELRLYIAIKLSRLLADEFLLFTKTLNAQWNAEKPGFRSIQMFFVLQARQIIGLIDRVAERIHFFGYIAVANPAELAKISHLNETNETVSNCETHVIDLCAGHNCIIEFVTNEIEPLIKNSCDERTGFFLRSLLEEHKKMILTLIALS